MPTDGRPSSVAHAVLLNGDLLTSVFAYLSHAELARMSRVCRTFRAAANDPLVWRLLLVRDFKVPGEKLPDVPDTQTLKDMYKQCIQGTLRVELVVDTVANTPEEWATRNKTTIHIRSGCALPCRPPIPFTERVESAMFFKLGNPHGISAEKLKSWWSEVFKFYKVRNKMRMWRTEVVTDAEGYMTVGFFFVPDDDVWRPTSKMNDVGDHGPEYYGNTAASMDPLRFLFNIKASFLSKKLALRYAGQRALLAYNVYKYIKKLRKLIRERKLAAFERNPLEAHIPIRHKSFIREMHIHSLSLFGFDISTKVEEDFLPKEIQAKVQAAREKGIDVDEDEIDFHDFDPVAVEHAEERVREAIGNLTASLGPMRHVLLTSTNGSSAELRFTGGGFPICKLLADRVDGALSSRSQNSEARAARVEARKKETIALFKEKDMWDLPVELTDSREEFEEFYGQTQTPAAMKKPLLARARDDDDSNE